MLKNSVVLVSFPFDDLTSSKVRPAVCLTNPIGPHRHVIVAFITSGIPANPLETDLVIESGQSDFAASGLRVSSTLQLHRLMTVTQTLLRRKLGQLPPRLRDQVYARLLKLFELT
jgi:mRNA interferase MazF